MSNLFKGNFISLAETTPYIIDSNSRVEERLSALAQQADVPGEEAFTEGLDAASVADLLTMDPSDAPEGEMTPLFSGNVIKADHGESQARAQAQEILEQAQAEAQQMVEDMLSGAQAQVEDIKRRAHDEGYNQGYEDGMKRANSVLAQKQAELESERVALEQDFEAKAGELEPLLVDIISDVYNHIFKVDFAQHKDLIVTLIRDTLRGTESQSGFLVHVSGEDYQFVNMQKKELLSVIPGDVPLDIIEDATLAHNECYIETGNGIYDCGLDTQLMQLRKELMLLSYRKN